MTRQNHRTRKELEHHRIEKALAGLEDAVCRCRAEDVRHGTGVPRLSLFWNSARGTMRAHTELKDLSKTGAKLLNLVPGVGLEPARTRQGPRDFKSRNYKYYDTVTDNKALYQRAYPSWYGAFVFLGAG